MLARRCRERHAQRVERRLESAAGLAGEADNRCESSIATRVRDAAVASATAMSRAET
jgi:hypothetical protein